MAAAKPPRATVVVPLVARPLVTWMTATPASAHSNAAMVPAAPPPTISTSASWWTTGISRPTDLFRCVIVAASGLRYFDECVHAAIGKGAVVDVQRQFLDAWRLQMRFEGVRENPVVLGMLPRTHVVALKIVGAALGMLAETFERHENAHRPFGLVEAPGEFAAQLLELLGIGAHQQVVRVVLEEFASLVTLGHLADPEVGVVDRSGNDHLGQAGRAGVRQSRVARGIHSVDDQIGEFMRGHVDDARKFARSRQSFERLAADARGVEQDDLVAQGFEAFGHAIDAARRAAK